MAELKFWNGTEKGRGYSFSLFPVLCICKTKWKSKREYSIEIGLWFWSMEINWFKYLM